MASQERDKPTSTPSSDDATPSQRKKHKLARQDGNILQKLLWKCLRPPRVPQERSSSGKESYSPVSRILFEWPWRMIWAATTRQLHINDIPSLDPRHRAGKKSERFIVSFDRYRSMGSRYPLLRAILHVWRRPLSTAVVCGTLSMYIRLAGLLLFREFGVWLQQVYFAHHDDGRGVWPGVVMVLGVGGIAWVSTIFLAHMKYQLQLVGGEVRTLLSTCMYAKAMRISRTAVRSCANDPDDPEEKDGHDPQRSEDAVLWTDGSILHSMAVDTQRIESAIAWSHVVWLIVVFFPGSVVLAWYFFSWPGIVSAVGIVPNCLIAAWNMARVSRLRKHVNASSEQRAVLLNDMLLGARYLKLFAWEESFLRRLRVVRDKEARGLVRCLIALTFTVTFTALWQRVLQLAMTIVYRYFVGDLSLAYNVVSFQQVTVMSIDLTVQLATQANILASAVPSFGNVQDFFLAEEHVPGGSFDRITDSGVACEFKDAEFCWLRPATSTTPSEKMVEPPSESSRGMIPLTTLAPHFKLSSVNLAIKNHELIAIVGPVGCGKSSLAAALAGEMVHTSGTVRAPYPSAIAWCPQVPWIQNATLRENITFGMPFDGAKFSRVVQACALERDIDHEFPDGDMTELGERGLTVSGGQKMRIQLARTLYLDRDFVILDDPLAAVDSKTAEQIVEDAIKDLLSQKTVVLVTHQLHILGQCDRVVWMDSGRVLAVDTYDNLMAHRPDFADFAGSAAKSTKDATSPSDTSTETASMNENMPNDGSQGSQGEPVLLAAEEIHIKSVPLRLYSTYLRLGVSWLVAVLYLCVLLLSQALNTAVFLLLPWWTAREFGLPDWSYMAMMAIFAFGNSFTWSYSNVVWQRVWIRASKQLVQEAVVKVFAAPMSFFDTTPLGWIMNRFSLDVNVADLELPVFLYSISIDTVALVSLIVPTAIYVPISLSLFVPWVLAIWLIVYLYRSTPLELRRLEATRSSIFVSKLQEGIHGRSTLISCNRQSDFQHVLHTIVDELNSIHFSRFAAGAWSETHAAAVSCVLTFLIGVLGVQLRFSLHPSLVLFSLACAPNFTGFMTGLLETMAEVQRGMNAVERLHHYRTRLPNEGERQIADAVGDKWPTDGSIVLYNVSMRYRPNLSLSLHNVNLSIHSGEKIAIVGRTGAGKSSMANILFRTMPLNTGSIRLAGIDISTVGLHTLRRSIAIVPQDPSLFVGTLRHNLDPDSEYTDERLLAALNAVGFDDKYSLDDRVESEGRNFSSGSKQLIALARALARDVHVMVMDEATSSVDLARDVEVQNILRRAFQEKTVIAIAHRLRTVIGYDRVVVMDRGTVAEVGSPRELWNKTGGMFRDMCDASKISLGDFGSE